MLRWPHYGGQTLVKNSPTPLLLQLIDCRRDIKVLNILTGNMNEIFSER